MKPTTLLIVLSLAGSWMLTGCSTTPFTQAAKDGDISKMDCLLKGDKKINVNDRDWVNMTALSWAAISGQTNSMRYLLDHGANINQKARGNPPLKDAIISKHPDCVKFLLDNGADVNIKDDWDMTSLMTAIQYNQSECAKILLDYGVDIDCRNQADLFLPSHNATEWAVVYGCPNIVKMIEDTARARVERKIRQGNDEIVARFKTATLSQLLEEENLSQEQIVSTLTDRFIEIKNQELPTIIVKSTVEQRASLLSAIEKRLMRIQSTIVELNGKAEDAIRKGQDAADFRRQVGKLQACIAVLSEIKNILTQS
jgi:hypothetical protein